MARLMRDGASPAAVDKTSLMAAVNAADDWIDSNSTAFSSSLPDPYKTESTADEKEILLAYVAMRRAGKLPTEEDA